MNFSRVAVISIPVADQDAAKTFYTEKLGFQIHTDAQFGENQRWLMLNLPGVETHITLVTWFPQMPPGNAQGMVLETKDIQADYAELQARGLSTSPIESAPWGSYLTFSDPDGNGWVLQQNPG